ncbi:general odorant-binding protein 19d-like [Homalodisca vitripennis]|uniref:general odorant-binding protein 19d-like n=1 Tax=Homalodisca vitripennis TaxID=197043 RepID=UPI001EEC3D1B|nr:general odorant-binding protein 19d-like [Homalodisca vitripennis]
MGSQGLLFAVLLAFIAIAHAKVDLEEAEKFFNKCKEETGAEETFEDTYKKDILPSSEKGKCLLECKMRLKGVYDEDGKYSPEGAKKYISKVFDHKRENIDKVLEIFEECKKIDVEGLNKCEVAYKHVECGQKKLREHNISFKD